jgi:hypothetical protein
VSVTGATGSFGVGVGVAITGTGSALNGVAAEPVTENSAVCGFTAVVSQAFCRQPRPKLSSIVRSTE